MEINPRLLAFVVLLGFLVLLAFGGDLLFPKNKDSEENVVDPIIVDHYIEVLVTPTPDGKVYFASEYQNGTRMLHKPFSWIRYNALMKQDMKVTTIVYDYKFFEKLHWFNPAEYKYHESTPVTPGFKYLLVFVYMYMDDVIGDDTRMWAVNRSTFAVQVGAQAFVPQEYPYQLRFREVENTYTFNDDARVEGFKSRRGYNEEEYYIKSAGEYNDEIYYLRGGVSNAIDGYLIFEVPEEATAEDCMVLARFYAFGNSNWRLA